MKTWSSDVVLCTGGRRLAAPLRKRLDENGVAVRTSSIARLEHESGLLQRIVFDRDEPLVRDALFFSTGQYPQCDLAVNLGCAFNSRGTVKTGTLSDTNVDGVFVAGDASRDAQFVIVAAAEGVKAAMAINEALQKETLRP
jgi:thioredoxin reductase